MHSLHLKVSLVVLLLGFCKQLNAQSFDTLVLRNVEKKYVTGKLVSIQKDFVVYFRQNLPSGPEFRMNKENVRWIVTSSNEIIEVSEKFNPEYRIVDSTISTSQGRVTESNPSNVTPSPDAGKNAQEYYSNPVSRTEESPQVPQSEVGRNTSGFLGGQSNADLYIQGQRDAARYYKGYRGAGTGTLLVGLLSPLVGLIPAIACSSTQPQEINLNYPNAELMKKSNYYDGYTYKAKKIKQGKVWANWSVALGVNIVAFLLLTSGQ